MYYDKITRLLHWGFALLIPLQLLSEELMKRPKPGRIRDDMQVFFFDMHETIGWVAFVLVVARIAWLFVSAESSWSRLFPYFSAKGFKGLVTELKNEVPGWFKGKLTDPNQDNYFLAGAIHGLGLLLVSVMGITGIVMALGMEDTGKMLGFIHDAKEVHEVMGELLWIYIYGHVVMVVLHMLVGHKVLQRIFGFQDT